VILTLMWGERGKKTQGSSTLPIQIHLTLMLDCRTELERGERGAPRNDHVPVIGVTWVTSLMSVYPDWVPWHRCLSLRALRWYRIPTPKPSGKGCASMVDEVDEDEEWRPGMKVGWPRWAGWAG
jgi:hypothetical protein